ncbi:hypothetical protein [Mycolicibacterium arenosum]|uniref:Transposase n=1 Tax=Mycolicibacterium arenosum TaxID=2952157 RepID=A0ABT1MBB7_9MYCO|nr:hypothetical protein [Mycolicibacterium sp. CAU 1645]MCP9276155.1 hypothetical protein [Mycolicibacterium sp. CAU 1645]
MTLQADLDTLYGVVPEEFTALRTQLVTAAKKRGDSDAAKEIAHARRPTAAAWVVNNLVRTDSTARTRLTEMTSELRAAHSAMDGARIRELTTLQRRLVTDLVRAAFAAAALADPSAALRGDVTETLQAAIADPEVAARLGRLVKAEQWSGFGDFGASLADASTDTARPDLVAEPKPPRVSKAELRSAEKRHANAEAAVADGTSVLATARRRYERLLETLAVAEQAVHDAEQQLQDANNELAEADSAWAELRGESRT